MVSWYRCAVLLSRDSYDLVVFFHLAALQRERHLGVGPSMALGDADTGEVSDAGLRLADRSLLPWFSVKWKISTLALLLEAMIDSVRDCRLVFPRANSSLPSRSAKTVRCLIE